jgi:hypothetical protein
MAFGGNLIPGRTKPKSFLLERIDVFEKVFSHLDPLIDNGDTFFFLGIEGPTHVLEFHPA